MSVSVIATGDTVICKLLGADNLVKDMLNVQLYQYQAGLTPEPGGTDVMQWAPKVLAFWSALWGPFQSNQFLWNQCTVQRVKQFVGVAPDRWKATLWDQWTVFATTSGAVAQDSLPSYVSYNIQKVSAAAGRGRQGHIRISGVPESMQADGVVDSIPLAAINAALTPGTNMIIPFGGGFTDQLVPITNDGKLVNTNPGQPSSFYARTIDGFVCHPNLGSQITRKALRHRS